MHSSEKICMQIGHRYACDSQVSSCIAMQHSLVSSAATVCVAREILRRLLMLMTCTLDYASCLPPRILRCSWPYIQRLVYRSSCAAKHHRVYAVILTISYVSMRSGSGFLGKRLAGSGVHMDGRHRSAASSSVIMVQARRRYCVCIHFASDLYMYYPCPPRPIKHDIFMQTNFYS